jgi:hypothetical protein
MYRFENIEAVSFNSRRGHSVDIYKWQEHENAYMFVGNYFVQGAFSESKALRRMTESQGWG